MSELEVMADQESIARKQILSFLSNSHGLLFGRIEYMTDEIRKEIEKVSAEWEAAMIANKAEAIGRFMAEDWVIIGETGTTTKEQFLSVVASGDLTHETFKGEVISVKRYGETAVVYGRVRNNGKWKGHAFSADEWTTDVFVRRDGRWLCVHSQITAVKDQ